VLVVSVKVPPHPLVLQALLEGLAAASYVQLRRYALPRLYESGVYYQREPKGRERWQTAVETYRRGAGDCEDLTAWRVAELRFDGEPARGIVIPTGPRRYHAIVERADGSLEDPSRRLRR
jgi:hypothetical protein